MAVADRAKRLHALARELNKHFELPAGTVVAELDHYYRPAKWFLRWMDGPPMAQVIAAAKKIDDDVLGEAKLFRSYSDFTWALATIRLTMSRDEPPWEEGYYPNYGHLSTWLEKRTAPRARSKREQVLADRLAVMFNDSLSGRPSDELIQDYVRERGVAPLLQVEGHGEIPLSPLEVLTDRYATGEALKAWKRRLVPLKPLEAFLAVLADQEPEPDAAAAALALVPEVHQAVDRAAEELGTRVTGEAQAS
ncbi:hypothetical protein ACWEGS_28925 [Streptomyces sp. NPDC004822]